MTAKNSEYQQAILQVMGLQTYDYLLSSYSDKTQESEVIEAEDVHSHLEQGLDIMSMQGPELLKQDIQLALSHCFTDGNEPVFLVQADSDMNRSAEGIVLPSQLAQLSAQQKQRLWAIISQ